MERTPFKKLDWSLIYTLVAHLHQTPAFGLELRFVLLLNLYSAKSESLLLLP